MLKITNTNGVYSAEHTDEVVDLTWPTEKVLIKVIDSSLIDKDEPGISDEEYKKRMAEFDNGEGIPWSNVRARLWKK